MSLWAEWTGEGLTGGTIPDQSGNSRDLVNAGLTSSNVDSPFGVGFYISDTAGNNAADYADAVPAAAVSICCNIYLSSAPSAAYFLHDPGDTSRLRMVVYSDSYGSTLYISFCGVGASLNIDIDTMYQVVCSCDGTDVEIYIDDMSTARTVAAATLATPAAVRVGEKSSADGIFGSIGEIAIYDSVLDQSAREEWANSTVAQPEPPSLVPSVGRRFVLTLSGAADSTTDIDLPVSNLNARLRSGSPSYLQVTIPYTSDYAAAVAARSNGDIKLTYIDADDISAVVTTVDLETIQFSRGSSSSIVLTGHRQTTNSSPGSHTVAPLSMQTGTNSTNAIIPGYKPEILPADSVTAEGTTYAVETVSIQASVGNIQTQLIGS